jgi:hypothetical protein
VEQGKGVIQFSKLIIKERHKMAIATMTKTATVKKKVIEVAFEKMGLKEKLEELWDIIDEMELEKELELSWEACERGEHDDVFEAIEEIRKEINER